ncbi:MAG: TlpA family protein disulfide reductase [Candidatus Omnitrophica bacterium]|nr:TlpA family protein disulfide reductase [Candidatus Omnitrophota bacterium]
MKSLTRIFVLSCLFFGALGSSYASGQFFFFQNPMVGEVAPDFILETLNGGKKSLEEFRDGDPAIVFFWATWCLHCRTQLKELNDSAAEIQEKGIKLVLVDLGESSSQVRAYLKDNGVSLNVFLDKTSEIAEEYGVVGIPTFYFLDKKGIIQAVEHDIPENHEALLLGKGDVAG